MAPVAPYALSIHGFIDKIGADAGFAAIIGVALVVIMLFVHARETASLRARAEDAEDRVEYLERVVEQLGRSTAHATQLAQAAQAQGGGRPAASAAPAAARVATGPQRPAPAPAVAAAYATTGRPRVSGPPPLLPAAPVGSGGPALSSATRLIPAPSSSNGHRNGGGSAAGLAPAAAMASPAPSTAAAGAPAAMPQFPAPRDGDGSGLRPRHEDTGPRSVRRDYGRAEEPVARRRLVPIIAVAVLVAAIAVAAVLLLLNHHSPSHRVARTRSTASRTSARGHRRVTVNPRRVTVAVLNGTTTSNLAADISQKLAHVGFRQGKTANFSSQSLTTTTIGYQSGHRAQALAVAKALKVTSAHVLGVAASTRQLVCPAAGTCADQVFVVLGSDLASAG
jgi:hypothetical protein